MKIAIFSDTFPPQINGVSHFVCKSAEALAKLGHEVRVFAVSSSKKQSQENSGYLQNPRIVFLPSTSFWGYPGERFELPLGFALAEIRKFKPDVIHTHTPFGVGWEAVWAGKIFNIPIVGTHHTFFDHYLKYVKMDYEWLHKFSWGYTLVYYNRCNLILSPSKALAEALKNYGLKRPIDVLPNFIDTNFFQPAKNRAEKEKLKEKFGVAGKALIYMGRVSYEKSIDKVIDAFALAAKKVPNIKLLIIGDGQERPALERLATDLGIKNKIDFLGFKRGKDLLEVLQAGDIFLTASKSENMPLSVLEAMAAGLPVIGVDSLGIPEIVRNNKNGFILPPDDYKAMAEKIIELVKDDKIIERFSMASHELAMEYSEERTAKLLENAYKKLIK